MFELRNARWDFRIKGEIPTLRFLQSHTHTTICFRVFVFGGSFCRLLSPPPHLVSSHRQQQQAGARVASNGVHNGSTKLADGVPFNSHITTLQATIRLAQ
jgi:hypothetical protein